MTLEHKTCVMCGESLYDEGKSPRLLHKIASSNFPVWADIQPGTAVCSDECQLDFQRTFVVTATPLEDREGEHLREQFGT